MAMYMGNLSCQIIYGLFLLDFLLEIFIYFTYLFICSLKFGLIYVYVCSLVGLYKPYTVSS